MPRSEYDDQKPTRFPIGLMSIASSVRDKGFLMRLSREIPDLRFARESDMPEVDVRIIDLQAEARDYDLEAELRRINPDIVGISAVTQLFSAAGRVSKLAAKAVPGAIRVIGGVHISAVNERNSPGFREFEDAMSNYDFNIAVLREGEEKFAELVMRLASQRDITYVPGIVIRNRETGDIYRTDNRYTEDGMIVPRLIGIDDYPLPALSWDLINHEGYEPLVDISGVNRGVPGSLMTSRGCPFHCSFCASNAIFGRRVEHVSAENIFAEMKYYYQRGTSGFYIMDDNLCLDPEKIKKLADLVEDERKRTGMDITYSAFAHANSITPDVAGDLRRSGCVRIALGVESGDEALLKRIGKSTSLERISNANRYLQEAGISVKFFLLVGLPGQNWASIKKTAEIILKDRPGAIDVAVTTPYPGSAIYGTNDVRIAEGVSYEQLSHIVPPQLKMKANVDVLTYTDAMTSEEIARSRDLLNALFKNINDEAVVQSVMREIEERVEEDALNGYPETNITRARKVAREARNMRNTKYGMGKAEKRMRACFVFIRRAIGEALLQFKAQERPIRLENIEVTARAPVRLDIASGRGSDLFVFSMEKGGKVLNAAITLNGAKPVKVTARAIPEYEIRIYSSDGNQSEVITDISQMNPDVSAPGKELLKIYKAALIEAGIVPGDLKGNLRDILRRMGGGIEMAGRVEDIPAGSGLGVSSILAITLMKALYELTGRTPDDRELIMRTVSLEQRLWSYGGWQDPVGGAFGGLKWITAERGDPVPGFRPVKVSKETLAELESRIVLLYTGKPHFAGDILTKIITGYLLRENPCYSAMVRAQALRDGMLKALEEGDVDRFGRLAGEYWKATVDQIGDEASNKVIDRVLGETADIVEGGKASGAGGGGFFFLVAKRGKEQELRDRLAKMSSPNGVKVYGFSFDDEGITVTKRNNPGSVQLPPAPTGPVVSDGAYPAAPVQAGGESEIAASWDGSLKTGDDDRLRKLVREYFDRVESAPGHKPLNYIYSEDRDPVDIGGGLLCDLVLNKGRQAYVRKTLAATKDQKDKGTFPTDVMMGHMTAPGSKDCFLCGVEDKRIIARIRFKGSEYLLLSNGNPHGPDGMILSSADPQPQRLSGEFMSLMAGCVRALGEGYEASYSEPSASASVYHRHAQIRRSAVSILRSPEKSLGLEPMGRIGVTGISEVRNWPATAYSFDGANSAELGQVFGAVLDEFHSAGIPSNVNLRFYRGKFRALQYPRISGREKPDSLCPEHPDSYGRYGGLEMGGWIIFLGDEGYNFMKDLMKNRPDELRRRIRASLSETSVPRDAASVILKRAIDKLMKPSPEAATPFDIPAQETIRSESDNVIASIIVLARKAKRDGQKLIIGLDTGWIPGMDETGYGTQRDAIGPVITEIENLGDKLHSLGLDNVTVIHKNGEELSDALLAERRKTGTKFSNIVVLASRAALASERFAELRSTDSEERAFLAAVDPAEIEAYMAGHPGRESAGRLNIELLKMLSIALDLASGKEPPQMPLILSYDRKLRIVTFLPKAEPADYEALRNRYKAEQEALSAA
jgi:galactokinase/mevalonate kinase-like predicted kinase/radical SAM superfamily enzyme YgiQ (UPF0313 family)